ncbi:hypothetical protein EC973_003861 [Apophysomyces ossiformis]|uniref:Zn(2)-C6 fungal-type domain-containing protein n=1 Tax=Apophysomyces ossiformis TaxID=679940 RepID=A0A8H7BQH2_9FUNG|nr:hypothetical protein EC973_003861 [Apophysomyces ossiformis]
MNAYRPYITNTPRPLSLDNSAAPTTSHTVALKRTRAKRSCDFCRKRKSRCDADTSNPCSNCKAWGYTCEFQTVRKKRGPPSVYVENLEKRCKKMETLLTELTRSSIKELEQNDFQLPCQKLSRPLRNNSNSKDHDENDNSSDEEDEPERINRREKLATLDEKDYDSIKYTGHSAGLKLFDQGLFKSKPYIQWPGRDDVVLQMMSQNELMIVRKDYSSKGGRESKLDVGLSMWSGCLNGDKRQIPQMIEKPPKEMCDKMLQIYFEHLHQLLPIIDKNRFLEQTPPTILLHAVLCLSFRFASLHFPELIKSSDDYGAMYFEKVMKRLRDVTRSRLCYVQAALLITLYLDFDDGDVESVQWHTLGSAIRIAQDLGLHRSCAHWKLPASEIETRHRVFYACYILDRWMSVRAGKPLTILDRDFDTSMPSLYEVSDNGKIRNEPVYRSFNLMIKLSEILGRVIKALYAPKAKHANGTASLDDPTILIVLERRLQAWKALLDETVDGFKLSSEDKVNLLIPYYTIVLLLHRPFIESSGSWLAKSQQASFEAASSISDIIRQKRTLSHPESSYPLCLPTCFVYALFQSALVHLSAALGDQSTENLRKVDQSVALIKSHKYLASAHRAFETLKMLAAINGLEPHFSTTPSPLTECKTDLSTDYQSDCGEQETSKPNWFHRMANTDMVESISSDIHHDVESMMDHHPSVTPYLHGAHQQQQPAETVYTSPIYQPMYASATSPLDHFATAAPSQLSSPNHTETCYEQPQLYPPSLRTLLHNSALVAPPTPAHSAAYIPATSMEQSFVSHHPHPTPHHQHQPTPPLSHTPVPFSAYSAPAMPATLPSSNMTWSDWGLLIDHPHATAAHTTTIPTVASATPTHQPILSTHLQHVASRLH